MSDTPTPSPDSSELPTLDQPPGTAGEDLPTLAAKSGSIEAVGEEGEFPKRFGDYELLGEIARGGMGVVYRANQVSLSRPVALKMILAGDFASSIEVQRFHAEAEAAAGLDHSGIVPIYDIGREEGRHYFSMKLIDGESLSRAARSVAGDQRAAAELMVKIAGAIHHAHQRGILHRDLKPGNILIDGEGEPHVTDFGLARQVESESDLTRTGAVLGTPAYMPPEQAQGDRQITTAADIYSLGAILYELLTGRPPFKAKNAVETVLQVISEPPKPPREINASIDRTLELICLKCLAKDPAERYGSAEALGSDLQAWLAGEPVSVRPPSAAALARMWLRQNFGGAAWMLVLGVAFGVALGVVVWFATIQTNIPGLSTVYDRLPSVDRPWMMRLNWEFSDAQRVVLISAGFILFGYLGLATSLAVRPKNRSADFVCGLVTSGVAGLALFASLFSHMSAIGGVSEVEPLLLMRAAADPKDGAAAMLEQFPDLADVPEADRPELLYQKFLAECISRIPVMVWAGMALSLAMSLVCCLAQTVFAGPIVRRTRRAWWALLLYSEIAVPVTLLSILLAMYVLAPITVSIHSAVVNGTRLAALVALLVLGAVAAWRQSPGWLRAPLLVAWAGVAVLFLRYDFTLANGVGTKVHNASVALQLLDANPDDAGLAIDASQKLAWVGYFWWNNDRFKEAEDWLQRAVELREPALPRIANQETRNKAQIDLELWQYLRTRCLDEQGEHQAARRLMEWFSPGRPESWSAHASVIVQHVESMLGDGALTLDETPGYIREYVAFQVNRQNGAELSAPALEERIISLASSLANKQPWLIVGPFIIREGESPTRTPRPPEDDLGAGDEYRDGPRSFSWRSAEVWSGWYVDLLQTYGRGDNVVAYAKASVWVDEPTELLLGEKLNGGGRVWLNGELVTEWTPSHSNEQWNYVPVQLTRGANTVLVKVWNTSGAWGFNLDFFDQDRWPAGVEWRSAKNGGVAQE
ncbi:MAG: serine/threonine-protein kinase [Planctomycetota bacterium]